MKKYYIITSILLIILSCNSQNKTIEEEVDHFEKIYGISSDTLNLDRFVIGDGQNLSDILVEHGVNFSNIDRLVQNSADVYDVRKMRAGNQYFLLSEVDTLSKPKFLVYERNPIDFVVFNLSDSFNIYLNSKPISVDTVTTDGIIDESLWITMLENNDDPELAIKLSEIFAWTIDFFGIHKNDKYKIVYEKMYADTQYVGIRNIIATTFEHINAPYYAFNFVQDSIPDYFDERGGSLRRAFLKAPVRYSRISSRFSYNRRHPILKIRRPHFGVDYVAPTGTPVQSIGDGIVVSVGRRAQEGRVVKIKHNGTYTTQYLHLSRFGSGIKRGVRVSQGQVIGYVGSTGLSTGAHLDFRFYKNGKPVDPLKVKSPPVNPVKPEHMDSFTTEMNYWKDYLDSISFPSSNSIVVSDSI